jgi:hypothetical protein
MKQIGQRLGVTKNAVIGKLDRLRKYEYDGSTTMSRLQALHDRLERVLAENARRPSFVISSKTPQISSDL